MEHFKLTLVDNFGSTMEHTHFHENYEIYFLLEGSRDFFIKNHTYKIQPQDLVFLSPKVIHKTIVRDDPYVKRYAMLIPKDFISTLAMKYDGNLFDCFRKSTPILHLDNLNYSHVTNLFEQMHQEYDSDNTHKDFIISVLVTELLFYLNRFHTDEVVASDDYEKSLSRQIIDFLVTNYKDSISLEDISNHLYVNTFYICRIFKIETGFTVMEYLTYVRLREAMHLLDTTNLSVTDISFTVGFNNINHFIRTFRKNLNTTPKQYQLKQKDL